MATVAMPMTTRTLRRHHSTVTMAAANTGNIQAECELTPCTIDP
jgi:hypothetical protein